MESRTIPELKLRYDASDDKLHIDLAGRQRMTTLPGPAGVSVDVDDDGLVVGITIEHARSVVDMATIESVDLGGSSRTRASSTIRVNVSTGGNSSANSDANPTA